MSDNTTPRFERESYAQVSESAIEHAQAIARKILSFYEAQRRRR